MTTKAIKGKTDYCIQRKGGKERKENRSRRETKKKHRMKTITIIMAEAQTRK